MKEEYDEQVYIKNKYFYKKLFIFQSTGLVAKPYQKVKD